MVTRWRDSALASILVGTIFASRICWVLASTCEVRLGGAIAASGKFTTYGQDCVRGWTFWAEQLNSRGGFQLPGSNCLIHLPLDMRDDESSKSKSAQLLADMLNPNSSSFANLDFVIGPASSGITLGNAAVARSFKRILFSHGASESLYNHNNTYIFSSLTPGRQYMSTALKLLWSRGARSVVFAHESKSFSTSVCDGGNETATSLGMTVLGKFEYASGTTNFASIVYEIKVLNPDVYVGCGHLDDVTYLIGNANVLGVNPKAMIVTHASDERIVTNVGIPYSHGLLSPTQWDKNMGFQDDDGFFGSARKFYGDYSNRFGFPPSYQSAYSAAMGYALQKAVEKAGSVSTDKVRAALQTLSIRSFYGPIDFSSVGDPSGLVGTQPYRGMVTTQIQNATIQVVAPEVAASASVLYPVPSWSAKALLLYPCVPGYYEEGLSADGNALCVACPPGQYRDRSLMSCFKCGSGKVANSSASPSCLPCPAMTRPNFLSGSTMCVPCAAGTYCPEGTEAPIDCPQGSFCLADHFLPIACASGTYRNIEGGANADSCFSCEVGRYSSSAGAVECTPCSHGWFTLQSGQRTCQRCPVGKYQDSEGSSECKSCAATFVTLFPGAESADACVCGVGSFLNRAEKACMACEFSEGAYCPGGNGVPLVREGFYAELVGDPDKELGASSAFSSMLVWACPAPATIICPGRNLVETTNHSNLIGTSTCNRDCLSRLRLANECPPHHYGIVCSLCDDGYGLNGGTCTECPVSGLSSFVICGILVAMIGALLLYIVIGKPIPKSHTAKLLLACTCGQTIQFLQFILVLSSFNTSSTKPSSFESMSDWFGFLLLDSSPMVKLDCLLRSDVQAQYTMRAMLPMVAASAFFTNLALSRLLNLITFKRTPILSLDHTLNICGKAIVALHVALCKLAVNCFECREQEAAPDTLIRYPSVLCDSPEHDRMLPIGWSAIFIYVIGILAIVIYICVRAPEKYRSDKTFRHRYNFLIAKWRPDRWYWGAVNMTRNALIALVVFFFPRSPFLQTCMMGVFITICLVLQVHYQPWQNEKSNTMDACFSLCLLVFIFFSFRYLKLTAADSAETLNLLLTGLLVAVGGASAILIGYGIMLRINLNTVATRRNDGVALLALRFVELNAYLGQVDKDEFTNSLSHLPDSDLRDLSRALSHLQIFHRKFSHTSKTSLASSGRSALNFSPSGSRLRGLRSDTVSMWQRASSRFSAGLSRLSTHTSRSSSASAETAFDPCTSINVDVPCCVAAGASMAPPVEPEIALPPVVLPVLLSSVPRFEEAVPPDCEVQIEEDEIHAACSARAFQTKQFFEEKEEVTC